MRYTEPTIFFLIFLFSLISFSCQEEDVQDVLNMDNPSLINCTDNHRFTNVEFFTESEISTQTNIQYGEAPNWEGNNQRLLLDMYAPNSEIDSLLLRPVILIVHGGAFQGGNKSGWQSECKEFAKRGFVAFSMSYRLGWDRNAPDGILNAIYRANQDAHAALRYIASRSSDLRIDPNLIFIGGGSAGSITALNTVYLDQEEWNEALPSVEQRFGGLYESGNNLNETYTIKGVFNNWGSILESAIQTEEIVPTISFHGEWDIIVPVDKNNSGSLGSRALHEFMVENNACSDLTVKPFAGHVIYRDNEGTIFRVGRTSCFFKSIICESCESFSATEKIEARCSN